MHICMVTVALMDICKLMHLLMWVVFWIKCAILVPFSIIHYLMRMLLLFISCIIILYFFYYLHLSLVSDFPYSLFILFFLPFLVSPPPLFSIFPSISLFYVSHFSLSIHNVFLTHLSLLIWLSFGWIELVVVGFWWWVSVVELNRWPVFCGGLFRYLLDPFGGEIWWLLGLFGGWVLVMILLVAGFYSGWWWLCLGVLVLGFVWVFGDFLFRYLVSWVLGLGLNCSTVVVGGLIWLIGGGDGGWCFGMLYGGIGWFGFWVLGLGLN